MYRFSRRSLENLESCDGKLQMLAREVMALQLFDFGITEGYRSRERQDELLHSGHSKVEWPNSKHNQNPSQAFDFVLYVNGQVDWDDFRPWFMAVGAFRATAASLGIKIRCGADWDGDFSAKDQTFFDMPHIELIGD